MANPSDRNNNFVHGFEPVLLRSEVKKRLKEFRFEQMTVPRDMHIERHMVSAAIEYVLTDEVAQRKWLELIGKSIREDIDQSMALSAT